MFETGRVGALGFAAMTVRTKCALPPGKEHVMSEPEFPSSNYDVAIVATGTDGLNATRGEIERLQRNLGLTESRQWSNLTLQS